MEDFESQLAQVRLGVERYVLFRLNNAADAEDVFQKVCMTAYLKYDQLQEKNAFKAWLLHIARNKCNDYFRRKARVQEVPIDDVPEMQLRYGRQGASVQAIVANTMNRLPDRDRQVLDLYFWQELPQADIASRLGIPVGTVKSRLQHAKNQFRIQYPYSPKELKGDIIMRKLPETMPSYQIQALKKAPFSTRWEELQGWLIVPRVGQKLCWGMYDFPERRRTEYTEMEVIGRAEVHGIEGVEIRAFQYGDDSRGCGCLNQEERRFVAQLTDTYSRYLAETHLENGVRKCYTFLDSDVFMDNWGFGPDNCGNEVNLAAKGLIRREGNAVTATAAREILDVVGRYAVTICGKTYDTVCVMDVEFYSEAVATEQYIDINGRTVLWRRFNRDDWAIDRFGGRPWSEKLPDNQRITINGETYVHWYDCITDYIL